MPDCLRPHFGLCDSSTPGFPINTSVSWSLLKLMSIGSVMPSNRLILCRPPTPCPQSFPASGILTMSWLFASGDRSIGVSASASVLPVTTQGWFSLGLTGFVSLLSKGLSRVFSSTTVQKHQFFGAQPSLRSSSLIHTWLLERPCDNDWQPSKGYQRTTPTLFPKELQCQLYIQVVQFFLKNWMALHLSSISMKWAFLQSFIKSHFSVGWEANLMTLFCRGSLPGCTLDSPGGFKRYQCSHPHPQGSYVLAWGFL